MSYYGEADLDKSQKAQIKKANLAFAKQEYSNDPAVIRTALMEAWNVIYAVVSPAYLESLEEQ